MSYESIYKKNLFEDKVVLVTGSTGGGIGTTVATHLSLLGAKVILNGKDKESLENFAKEIKAEYFVADLTDKTAIESMFKWLESKFGRLDILINNAAYGGPSQKIFEIKDNIWMKETKINLEASLLCAKYASRIMVKQKYGKIIFISSSAAIRGTRGRNIGYSSSKAGLIGLTKQMALELGEFNINVNVICPSQIDTPRIRRNGRKTTESIQKYCKSVPLQRVGKPDDVSNLLIFLASDGSSYITGEVIKIDGGSSLASITTETYS